MLFIYEMMCFIQFTGNTFIIRNGADVFIRQLFDGFGIYAELVYGLFLLIIMLNIMCLNNEVIKGGRLKFSFLFYMLIESIFWSLGFILIMSVSENFLLSILERNIIPEQFYLAIGAGIWEELVFRVGLIGLILIFMKRIVGYNGIFAALLAIIISSVLFSLFHYLGPFTENFAFKSFYLRTLAGIFLGSLYLFRGFGIVAYTHIIYDIVIISLPVIFIEQRNF